MSIRIDLLSVLGRLPGTPSSIAREIYRDMTGIENAARDDREFNAIKQRVAGALKSLVSRGAAARSGSEWNSETRVYEVTYWKTRGSR